MAIWAYKAVMSCKKTPEQWLAEIHQRVETQPAGTLKWITAIQEDAERNPLKRIAELEKDLEAANKLAWEYSQKTPTTAQAMVYQNLLEKYNKVKEDGKRLRKLAELIWDTRWISDDCDDYQKLVGIAAEIRSDSFQAIDAAMKNETQGTK